VQPPAPKPPTAKPPAPKPAAVAPKPAPAKSCSKLSLKCFTNAAKAFGPGGTGLPGRSQGAGQYRPEATGPQNDRPETGRAETSRRATPGRWSSPHHPFYNDTTHTWTDAANLYPGDHLHTDNGATATAVATVILPASGDMWDLTVQDTHTFYILTATSARAHGYDVAAGVTSVLVHNTNCSTFGHLDSTGRPNIPNTSGVYRIEVHDTTTYIGKATDIHNRIHGSFRDGGALNDLGYVPSDVVRLSWIEMPGATERDLFHAENLWIDSEGGIGGLANRINSPGSNIR